MNSVSTKQVILSACGLLTLTVFALWLDIPIFRQILSGFTLFIIPGLFITLLLQIRRLTLWEYVLQMLGLSISFLYLIGLLLNQVFQALNLPNALATNTVVVTVISCLVMWAGIILKYRKLTWNFLPSIKLGRYGHVSFVVATTFPILSIWGAINLNNGDSNLIAVGTVLLMATYVLVVVIFHNQVPPHTFEYSLIMIGLAMLLSYSLRSWHITGWDINQEYYVYQLTKTHQQWRMDDFRDPYNACLSITILPTIINGFFGINDEFVFKVLYQAIFAAVPLVIYLTARKYLDPIFSYLASLAFVFQPWFIQPAPALARQEIALLFFSLIVWTTFSQTISKWQRIVLLIVWGASLIVSHYSTSYIALGMLALVFLLSVGLRRLPIIRNRFPSRPPIYISGGVLLVLLMFAFYWNTILTKTSGNLAFVAQTTLLNLQNIIGSDFRSEDVGLALGLTTRHFDVSTINDYIRDENNIYSSVQGLYPPETFQEFSPSIITSAEIPATLQSEPFRSLLNVILVIIKQSIKVFIFLGASFLVFFTLKSSEFDFEYVLLNLVSIGLLLSFLVIPVLSLYYNTFRVYLQTLVVCSVAIILGAKLSFSFVRNTVLRTRLIGGLLVSFFLLSSGVFSIIVGGPATMNLSNFGEDYDKFYIHEGEVYSAQWLALKRQQGVPIFADAAASLRLASFGNGILDTFTTILPSTFTENGYVYLRYANIYLEITEAVYKGRQISYRYPTEFLDKHKNLIYDNGQSQIFK